MKTAIIGWTGYIGQTIASSISNADLYNSKNILDICNKTYDILYFCGMPAEKWRINLNPEEDLLNTTKLIDILKTVTVNTFILISTVDVFDCTISQDENGICYSNHPYGKHRKIMEDFIINTFHNSFILRLPGLFGKGLKKNIIYDLIHNNQLKKICPNSKFQWYNTENIVKDINLCMEKNIHIVNLVSTPITVKAVVEKYFPEKLCELEGTDIVEYVLTTNTNSCGYWNEGHIILEEIGKFIENENKVLHMQLNLSVSNIATNISICDFIKILSRYHINNIEIAPTKITMWDNWNDAIINDIMQHNITFSSCQSILYNTNIQIFKNDTLFIHHYENVAQICNKLGIRSIVFGSPTSRHLYDTSEEYAVDLFRIIGNISKKYNINCCIEANSKQYNCTWLTNLYEVVSFVQSVNHPQIMVNYDLGNYFMENDTFIWDMSTIHLLGHVQISNTMLRSLHYLTNDNKQVYRDHIKNIITLGYKGCISLEMSETSIYNLYKSIDTFMDICI
jgi:sugar phosphate isomerase/epimerase